MSDGDVKITFGAETSDFTSSMAQVREILQGLTAPLRAVRDNLGGIAEAFVAAFAVEKVASFFEKMTELGSRVDHMAQQIGTSAEKVSEFTFAAGAAGVSGESAGLMMERLERSMVAAANATGQQAAAFRALGIDVKDAHGNMKSIDDIMPELAERFKNTANGAEKTAIAIAIMGRGGAQMIPFLNQGAAGLEKFNRIARETGTILTDEMAAGMEASSTAYYTLGKAAEGVEITIYEGFKPAVDALVRSLISMVEAFNDSIRAGGDMRTLFGAIVLTVEAVVAAFVYLGSGVRQAWNLFAGFFEYLNNGMDVLGRSMAQFAGGQWTKGTETMSAGIAKLQADWATRMKNIVDIGKEANDTIRAMFAESFGKKEDATMFGQEGGGPKVQKKPLPTMDLGKDTATQMQVWKEFLQKKLLDEEVFLADSKRIELAYWEEKKKMTKDGSREQVAVDGEIFQLKKALAMQDSQAYLASLNAKQEMVKENFKAVMILEDEKLAYLKTNYHADSAQYQNALREKESMERAHTQMVKQIQLDAANTQRDISRIAIGEERYRLDTLVQLNQISETDRLSAERNFLNQEYQMAMDTEQDRLKLPHLTEKEIADTNQHILVMERQHQAQLAQIQHGQLRVAQTQWKGLFDSISQGWSTMVRGILLGTTTLRDVWRNLLLNMVLQFSTARLNIELGWLAGQAAMAFGAQDWANKSLLAWVASIFGVKEAQTAADAEKVASGTATMAILGGLDYSQKLFEIANSAAVAAAAAFASTAAIPIVGPALAPEAAEAAYAATGRWAAALVPMATGTNYVPQDMMAFLHEGERVVPKAFNPDAGGSGGASFAPNVSITVNGGMSAHDIPHFKQAVQDVMRQSHRDFVSFNKKR